MTTNGNQPATEVSQQAKSSLETKASLFKRLFCGIDGWAVSVVGLALLVRVVYWLQLRRSPLNDHITLDHLYYFRWAQDIAAGDAFVSGVFEKGPLYPYLMSALFCLVGERFDVLYGIQMLCGVLTTLLVYVCGKRLFNQTTAVLGASLAAVYAPLIYYEGLVMKSFLSPTLTILACYALLRFGDAGRRRWLVTSGMAIGLACLVRENHVLLLIPAGLWVRTCAKTHDIDPRHQRANYLILAAACFVCLIPSVLRNRIVAGEWVLVTSGGGEVFYMAHGPDADGYYRAPSFVNANPFTEHEDFHTEAERRLGHPLTRGESSRYWFSEGTRHLFGDPLRSLTVSIRKLLILLNDFEVNDSENFAAATRIVKPLRWLPTFGWIGTIGLVGMFLCRKDLRTFQLPLGMVAVHVVSVLLTYNFARFRLGMMPLWCLFAAHGVVWLAVSCRDASGRKKLGIVATLVLVVSGTGASFLPPIGFTETTFAIDEEMFLGEVMCHSGEFEQAERHFEQALLLMRDHESRVQTHAGNQEAFLATKVANLFFRHDDFAHTMSFLRRAVSLPNAPEFRHELLRQQLKVLLQIDLQGEIEIAGLDLQATLAELRRLDPNRVEYWGLSARWVDPGNADEITAGLEQAWMNSRQDSIESQVWYQTGLAFLCHLKENQMGCREAVDRTLSLVPEHPWRPLLLRLRSTGQ